MKRKKRIALCLLTGMVLSGCGEESNTISLQQEAPTQEAVQDMKEQGEVQESENLDTEDGRKVEAYNYSYPVHQGTSVKADLDSDGQEEEICFKVEQNVQQVKQEDGEQYEVYDTPVSHLIINGEDVTEQFKKLSDYCEEVPAEDYYLVDLDSKDEYVELAIGDYGNNDYNVTNFFRYEKGVLKYVGSIQDMIDSETCKLAGDGTLQAKIRSELLETAYMDMVSGYELQDGHLKAKEQEWYYRDIEGIPEEHRNHAVLKDITVYKEKDTASEKKVLTPADGPVIFPATDNKSWVQVQTADGSIYYMHMTGFTEIDNDGTTQESTEVFDNLMIAG